ncbi:hypothetical protein [Microbacterium sp. ZOR0019]|uniref:hypothetical protein n=1 Tax=Microbacterium sp. ZOR0019 TaxID=1339233 RepID=UPI0018CF5445|nr:hypothetical protein [Microbacterium sp. ZOR0019]
MAVSVVGAALILAGCTTPEPQKTPKPTPSATATVEPTGAPTQAPVSGPKDEAQAVSDANKVYAEYKQAWFRFLADPALGPDYLEHFVWPDSRMATLVQDTYTGKAENQASVEGEPFVWQANEALSYVAPVTNNSTGEVDPLGAVNLFGCSDNTGVTFLLGGVENANIPKGSFPYQAVMIYSAEDEGWFVQDEMSLTGKEGAPLC